MRSDRRQSRATVRCADCTRSQAGAPWALDAKSFYVRRTRWDRGVGWTGSIRSLAQAMREADAWRDAGWEAQVLPNVPEVRERVRVWEQRVKATRIRVAGVYR